MPENEYLCSAMLKSEERSFEVLASQLSAEKAARREAQEKSRSLEQRVIQLEQQLSVKIDEMSSLMKQVTDFLMGRGAVSLSESLRDELVSGIRLEFEAQKRDLIASFEREKKEMQEAFAVRLAAKDNEIARLKGESRKGNNKKNSGNLGDLETMLQSNILPEDKARASAPDSTYPTRHRE